MLGEDFTEPSSLQVIFLSGEVVNDTACATFGIVNDDNLEFDHEFTVTLGTIMPNGPVVVMSSSSTTVSISDDEGMHCIVYGIDSLNWVTMLVSHQSLSFKFIWAGGHSINFQLTRISDSWTREITLLFE